MTNNTNGHYLAFVDELGKSADGQYLYRLDFTEDKEVVWGDYFNIVPAIIVPDIQPDINCLSYQAKFKSPIRLEIAKKNACFSMQDCIDGIISMCFCEINDDALYYDDEPFHLEFGDTFENIKEILSNYNIEIFDITEVQKGDESEIDNLIERLKENNETDDDEDE